MSESDVRFQFDKNYRRNDRICCKWTHKAQMHVPDTWRFMRQYPRTKRDDPPWFLCPQPDRCDDKDGCSSLNKRIVIVESPAQQRFAAAEG
ncbi:MAG TPA: hypothetical protein VNO31_40270 [Umezawaea sp.]|nr:hypothetical protein [Umezawaea sp.]